MILATCTIWFLEENAWAYLVKWSVTTKMLLTPFQSDSSERKSMQTRTKSPLLVIWCKGAALLHNVSRPCPLLQCFSDFPHQSFGLLPTRPWISSPSCHSSVEQGKHTHKGCTRVRLLVVPHYLGDMLSFRSTWTHWHMEITSVSEMLFQPSVFSPSARFLDSKSASVLFLPGWCTAHQSRRWIRQPANDISWYWV